MTEETKTTPTKPAKKAKPPALEDKPFEEFMSEHFTPSLEKALTEKGLSEVALEFKKQKFPSLAMSLALNVGKSLGI